MTNRQSPDWRVDGVKVVKSDRLDGNTAQTPGMQRAAAINAARGSQKLWAGTVIIHPNAKTGAHHHGELESVIYVVRGIARMRWGERLEFIAEADAGDFIFIPPYVPHQEINRSSDAPLECVLVRSGNESVVVGDTTLIRIRRFVPPMLAGPSSTARSGEPPLNRRIAGPS